jgi:ATP-dependent helicase/nuclease subunit A
LKVTGAQKQIIETKNKSLLISASAGSGKTFVVIERVLSTILKDYADVDRLLLVTFTNAAASEMKERLLLKLYDALDEYEKTISLCIIL